MNPEKLIRVHQAIWDKETQVLMAHYHEQGQVTVRVNYSASASVRRATHWYGVITWNALPGAYVNHPDEYEVERYFLGSQPGIYYSDNVDEFLMVKAIQESLVLLKTQEVYICSTLATL